MASKKSFATLAVSMLLASACGSAAAPTPAQPLSATAAAASSPLAPTPTATPAATASPPSTATPIATPALKSTHDLLAAAHPAVSGAQVVAAMNRAFQADPSGGGQTTDVIVAGATAPPEGGPSKVGFTSACQPADARVAPRQASCQVIVRLLFRAYQTNGRREYYDAALAVYDYAIHLLPPANVADMNRWLIQQLP